MANIGIKGNIALCIANWLNERKIKIRWKGYHSPEAYVNTGLPQGSVLSPFLFLLYLYDLFDILDPDVKILIYVDDIVIYVKGMDPDRTLNKLQDNINRVTNWMKYWKLSLSPDKCSSINFSRQRREINPIKIQGHALNWQNDIKFLGIYLSKSLSVNKHIIYLKHKAFKRLNLIKAVSSTNRGASSFHLIKIVNSLIRSLLDYCCFLYMYLPTTTHNSLETIYNAALRVATGLPKWTPINVLRRETNQPSILIRIKSLTYRFLIRQIAAHELSPLGSTIRQNFSATSPPYPLITLCLHNLLHEYDFSPSQIIGAHWSGFSANIVITHGLPFQDTNLPDRVARDLWNAYKSEHFPHHMIIATDASKDENKVSYAAINFNNNTSIASLSHTRNSIFTAEALAISLALDTFINSHADYIILSDSLSVLKALKHINSKSQHVIHSINEKLPALLSKAKSLLLIWCPAHRSIAPNEKADYIAKHGPFTIQNNSISPEDMQRLCKSNSYIEADYDWLHSRFSARYNNMDISTQSHRKLIFDRLSDVAIARWRTRMIPCNQTLYKINLSHSPLCNFCHELDSPEHKLLSCAKYDLPRSFMLFSLNAPQNITYNNLISLAMNSARNARILSNFSLQCT